MRTTFLVNLTDFSDNELVAMKKMAEMTARRNLGIMFRIAEFVENWQRRYVIVKQHLKEKRVHIYGRDVLFKNTRQK